ncbi:hypothetical protein [Parachryseolinea silvisoli]|uniref:hypothetical protein n=1 Tax=Parachryseolinea silvisoli TaxID=2873601 RepID=UPI002265EEF7|nr:hypothetical protein [Parachryseolinea silvisoli]MCD9015896.1 hypothetical protein [Parachryseolinea silvisoli]
MKPTFLVPFASLLLMVTLSACPGKKEDSARTTASAGGDSLKALFQVLPHPDSNKALLNRLCALRVMDPDRGEAIDSLRAARKIRAYKDFMSQAAEEAGYEYRAENDAYGFSFGINTLNEMVQAINRYNVAHPNDAVAGIRIYMGRAVHEGQQMNDVLLMPVLKSGHNFYNIDPDFTKAKIFLNEKIHKDIPPPMYNTSAPCPNRCQ